ncbi:MAG: class I SAM-dependent methyltransferase [Chloroflexi bacterium]|nr:class I SAM-dependent methyltransferase [Chloroflexota bacterium]
MMQEEHSKPSQREETSHSPEEHVRIIGTPPEERNSRAHWEERYSEGGGPQTEEPHPWLVWHRWRLPEKGRALDVACGMGRDTLFLARQGLHVHGLDFSAQALHRARERVWLTGLESRVQFILADATQFAFPRAYYDVVVVFSYWEPRILSDLKATLKPGGLLIYETFNIWWKRRRPHIQDKFLVQPGEMLDWLKDWHVLAYRELGSDHFQGEIFRPVSSIVARKPRPK